MGRADHNRKRLLKLQEKKRLEVKTVKNRLKRARDKVRGKELVAEGKKRKPVRKIKVSEEAVTGHILPPPIQADIKTLRAQFEKPPSTRTRNFTQNDKAWELLAPKLSDPAQKLDETLGKVAGIKRSVGRVDLARKFCAKSGKKRQQFFKDVIAPLLEERPLRRFLSLTALRVVKAQPSLLTAECGLSQTEVNILPDLLRAGDLKAASSLYHALLKLTGRALRGEDVLRKSKVLVALCNAQVRNFKRSKSTLMLQRRLDKLKPLSTSTLAPITVALGLVQPAQVMFLAGLAKAVNRKLMVSRNTLEDGQVVKEVLWQNFGEEQ